MFSHAVGYLCILLLVSFAVRLPGSSVVPPGPHWLGTKVGSGSGLSWWCVLLVTGTSYRCWCSCKAQMQTHIVVGSRAGSEGQGQLRAHWQLWVPWLLACCPWLNSLSWAYALQWILVMGVGQGHAGEQIMLANDKKTGPDLGLW